MTPKASSAFHFVRLSAYGVMAAPGLLPGNTVARLSPEWAARPAPEQGDKPDAPRRHRGGMNRFAFRLTLMKTGRSSSTHGGGDGFAVGGVSEGGFEDFRELRVRDDERNENANDVVESARSDKNEAVLVTEPGDFACFRIGRLAAVWIADEFHGAHAAEAANLADERPLFLPGAGARFKLFADMGGAGQQIVFFDGFDGGERSGARERMTAEGAAERAGAGCVHDFGAARDGSDRHAAAERLGHGNEVRFDAEMLGGKPAAGARETGLDFIGDEKNAVLAADVLENGEIAARRNDEAAFAEDRLGDDGSDGFRRYGALEGVLEMVSEGFGSRAGSAAVGIGEGDAIDIAGERLEAGFIRMRLAGEAHGEKGAAVEGILEANDGGPARVSAGDFDGVFDGFGAGIQEDGLFLEAAGSQGIDFFSERDVALIGRDGEAKVQVHFELRAEGRSDTRGLMTHIEAADSAGEIEVAVAVNVFERGAIGGGDEDRHGVVGAARDSGFAAGHERARTRAGNFRADMDGFHGSAPVGRKCRSSLRFRAGQEILV